MADGKKANPSPKSIKDSEQMWDNFMQASKICGAGIALILIIMGLTLV